MKASRTIIAIGILGVLAGGAGAVWAYRDYRQWLALGPGGLPYNFHGWLTATWMRRLKHDPLDTRHFAMGAAGDLSFLGPLPRREGPRPKIGVHPVPHRQLDQLPDAEMTQKIVGIFHNLVRRRSETVHYQLSSYEKRNQAVFLKQPETGSPAAAQSHGEIAHVHPSDGSMHMTFSPSDAKTVIEAGWGECHPLAGKLGLPDTYLLVYPPRDDQELALTARLLDATVDDLAVSE